MFLGISPVRISFAGGGTDMPEYYEKHGGNVVTSAITRFTYVIINSRRDNSFQIFSPDFQTHNKPTTYKSLGFRRGTELAISTIKYLKYKSGVNIIVGSEVPPRSGLGASSSLAVNLVKTISVLNNDELSRDVVAETAYHIGRNILKWPIGKQDEYIAAYGGFNYITFEQNKIKVSPIIMNKKAKSELQQNLLLFFIGGRTSSSILTNQINNIKKREKNTLESLHMVKKLAEAMHRSLINSDITNFGELLHKGWEYKKKFATGVTNEYVDKIYESALKHGAIGGKLTGAGGRGHLLLYCEREKQQKLIERMRKYGLKHVSFNFHNDGPKVLALYDFAKT